MPILVADPHSTILLVTCTVSVAFPSDDVATIVIRCTPWSGYGHDPWNPGAYEAGTGCPFQFQ